MSERGGGRGGLDEGRADASVSGGPGWAWMYLGISDNPKHELMILQYIL